MILRKFKLQRKFSEVFSDIFQILIRCNTANHIKIPVVVVGVGAVVVVDLNSEEKGIKMWSYSMFKENFLPFHIKVLEK